MTARAYNDADQLIGLDVQKKGSLSNYTSAHRLWDLDSTLLCARSVLSIIMDRIGPTGNLSDGLKT